MRAISGLVMVSAGVGLVILAAYLGLAEGLCEGQEPGGCSDHPDGLVAMAAFAGLALVVVGVGAAVQAFVRGPTRERDE